MSETQDRVARLSDLAAMSGAVKRVQRGWVKSNATWKLLDSTTTDRKTGSTTVASNVKVAYMDITLSKIDNPEKCQIRISAHADSNYLGELTSDTNLRIYGPTLGNQSTSTTTYTLLPAVTWEITEFA